MDGSNAGAPANDVGADEPGGNGPDDMGPDGADGCSGQVGMSGGALEGVSDARPPDEGGGGEDGKPDTGRSPLSGVVVTLAP